MKDFVKLVNSEKYGQILAVLDIDENDCPEIKVSIKPTELGLGVCSLSFSYEDSDEGVKVSEEAFLKLDMPTLEHIVEPIIKKLTGAYS